MSLPDSCQDTAIVPFHQCAGSREAPSLRVVVFDAVDVVLHVHGERHSIQTLFAHHTAETAGMVGLAECLEDLDAHRRAHRRIKITTARDEREAVEVIQ